MSAYTRCLLVGKAGIHHIPDREKPLRELTVPVQGEKFKKEREEICPDDGVFDTYRVHDMENPLFLFPSHPLVEYGFVGQRKRHNFQITKTTEDVPCKSCVDLNRMGFSYRTSLRWNVLDLVVPIRNR